MIAVTAAGEPVGGEIEKKKKREDEKLCASLVFFSPVCPVKRGAATAQPVKQTIVPRRDRYFLNEEGRRIFVLPSAPAAAPPPPDATAGTVVPRDE